MSEPRPEIDLDLPAAIEAVDDVHDALDRLWTQDVTVGPRDRSRIATAVAEIVGNIVEHAFRLDQETSRPEDRRLYVQLRLGPGDIEVVVADNGRPIAIDLSDVAMPDDDAESGRGLALAVAALDEVRYERIGDRNRWTLRCRRTEP